MTNFIDSFNKGISAAKDAERNKEEVNGVFVELNRQLSSATGSKVAISRKQYDHPIDWIKDTLHAMVQRKKYWALTVESLQDNKVAPTEFARWEQDFGGYPCRVIFGKNNYICEDKAALEEILEILLADPAVGDILLKYMNMSLPEN